MYIYTYIYTYIYPRCTEGQSRSSSVAIIDRMTGPGGICRLTNQGSRFEQAKIMCIHDGKFFGGSMQGKEIVGELGRIDNVHVKVLGGMVDRESQGNLPNPMFNRTLQTQSVDDSFRGFGGGSQIDAGPEHGASEIVADLIQGLGTAKEASLNFLLMHSYRGGPSAC